MSSAEERLVHWKLLIQNPCFDYFIAPCSCYLYALDKGEGGEKEIRPKLQFTSPGNYPILVCEYCGRTAIGETIEQCISKYNADMHEYELVSTGSIWEGRAAWFPLTEQMVLFGFCMTKVNLAQNLAAESPREEIKNA